MTNEFPPISPAALASSADRQRGLRYLSVGIAINALIWGITLFLLKDSPQVYTSQWSVLLLGKEGRNPDYALSQGVSASQAKPPLIRESDIKTSYKIIATTDTVRKAAAAKVGITADQFGKPQVELVEGTALMNFAISGSTREEAQKKAYALHEALQERLTQLRLQQAEEEQAGFENALRISRKKLETAQLRLSDYKVKAGLASKDQLDQLASNIETLRRIRAEIAAQQQDASTRARQLAANLNVTSRLAADAFTLRADALFQQYLQQYSESTAKLTDLSVKFGPNHPLVVRETAKQAAIQQALQARAQAILGRALDATAMAQLNLGSSAQTETARESLFKAIVTNQTEQEGLTARIQELDRQLNYLENRLNVMAQNSQYLDALNRNMKIEESVFSSRLAGLDASTGDIFGSYPPIQLVADPDLPETGIVPRRQPYFRIALLLSLVSTLVLLGFWFRKTAAARYFLHRYKLSG
ncbi:hypothetical protein K9N68_02115 [Kovacikia minuta CCNUW1]|uniref:hypothetical protein n=1 Tax=Kovacikia minuta TaxID=2931930 RepID=UPI001CCCCF28|nr:hypothetical protein [Kovacikia minuta]UBF26813.1 hypothetical protein K9N68_02115 [Kovacikia minuta CCNUW1]